MCIVIVFVFACQNKKNMVFPEPSTTPNSAQLKQIERKYGMFIHFGINTFVDKEWTDGSIPAIQYNPSNINAEQWVQTAKQAGMKYIILITKHHDGFCLWDSKYTDYDVASSSNTTNVIEEVAKACEKYDINLGLYYSLWDRKENGNNYTNEAHPLKYPKDSLLDKKYNEYMINQINELIDITEKYTGVVEFWFDGGWAKENYRWPLEQLYSTIKSRKPECQIGINWSIGLPNNPDFHAVYPNDQKEGYPIRYFPSDFRLGDPMLPAEKDPKLFSHNNKTYYMPWESTVCMSQMWFSNTNDTIYKSVEELEEIYYKATDQDNILILNCPPNKSGEIRKQDIKLLNQLKNKITL